ncbi:glutathione S-transferase family protein [Archangium sp.]|uniref:glutathione S-transferase family protein n=1 Tax=Archangium sp. TaxID=1872627 RepID=UPI00286B0474|nr:glutathione S-transferase family protein [Archangium sp.]
MIRLIQMPRVRGVWGLPNVSPACMKLETWLRMAEIPYELPALDLVNAPKGKVPYIVELDGSRMGDSTFIIEHLKSKVGKDPDAHLTDEQRAISLAFRRMMKENFYWVIVQSRYKDEPNWKIYKELVLTLLDGVPMEQRPMVCDMYKQRIEGQMYGHGIGRHSAKEVYELGIADLKSVSDMLGNKPYLLGDRPSTVDATVYAYVANLLQTPVDCAAKDYGLSLKNVVDYLERMELRYFPELRPLRLSA